MKDHATDRQKHAGQTERTDTELYTDGGVSRRLFLGAAGALSALPAVAGETTRTTTQGTTTDEQDNTTAEANTDEKAMSIADATVTASAEIGPATVNSPPDCFGDLEISVWEDYYGVQINIEAEDDESDHLSRFGMLLELDGDDVDQLIAALEAFR